MFHPSFSMNVTAGLMRVMFFCFCFCFWSVYAYPHVCLCIVFFHLCVNTVWKMWSNVSIVMCRYIVEPFQIEYNSIEYLFFFFWVMILSEKNKRMMYIELKVLKSTWRSSMSLVLLRDALDWSWKSPLRLEQPTKCIIIISKLRYSQEKVEKLPKVTKRGKKLGRLCTAKVKWKTVYLFLTFYFSTV